MISVIGSEMRFAVRRSRVTTSPIALSVVPGPAAWTRDAVGGRPRAASIGARSAPSTCSAGVVGIAAQA